MPSIRGISISSAVLPNRTAEAVGVALDGVLAKDDVLLCVVEVNHDVPAEDHIEFS